MHWSLGLLGFVIGLAVGTLAAHNRYSAQIDDLRVALGGWVRLDDQYMSLISPTDAEKWRAAEATERCKEAAREVLGR